MSTRTKKTASRFILTKKEAQDLFKELREDWGFTHKQASRIMDIAKTQSILAVEWTKSLFDQSDRLPKIGTDASVTDVISKLVESMLMYLSIQGDLSQRVDLSQPFKFREVDFVFPSSDEEKVEIILMGASEMVPYFLEACTRQCAIQE